MKHDRRPRITTTETPSPWRKRRATREEKRGLRALVRQVREKRERAQGKELP